MDELAVDSRAHASTEVLANWQVVKQLGMKEIHF